MVTARDPDDLQVAPSERHLPGHRVLVTTGDPIQPNMAGPGIRAWHIARALAAEHEVRLATTSRCALTGDGFETFALHSPQSVRQLVDWCDLLVVQGDLLHAHPFVVKTDKIVVADLYDPFHLEQLEQSKDAALETRRHSVNTATAVVDELCLRGDFFLCASERQRAFWLGHLAALGRINTASYDADPTLGSLLAVVPFGIPEEPPHRRRAVLKGVHPGIERGDIVILWAGGVYNWFDPLTLVHAIAEISKTHPRVRLVFLGMRHPLVPETRMARATRKLAHDLGLVGTHVFFNEEWVAYQDRADYLLDADIGVSCHLDTLETAFSFRTRMLDYLWAGLPMVATRGDVFADLIEQRGLGRTAEPGDVEGLVAALCELIDNAELRAECRRRIGEVAPTFCWSSVLAPLIDFCRAPRRAPDLRDPWTAARLRRATGQIYRSVRGWRCDLELVAEHYQTGGLRRVLAKMAARLGRRLLSALRHASTTRR